MRRGPQSQANQGLFRQNGGAKNRYGLNKGFFEKEASEVGKLCPSFPLSWSQVTKCFGRKTSKTLSARDPASPAYRHGSGSLVQIKTPRRRCLYFIRAQFFPFLVLSSRFRRRKTTAVLSSKHLHVSAQKAQGAVVFCSHSRLFVMMNAAIQTLSNSAELFIAPICGQLRQCVRGVENFKVNRFARHIFLTKTVLLERTLVKSSMP